MRFATLAAIAVLTLVACKKDHRTTTEDDAAPPSDAAPPPDARDARFTGSHALIKAGTEVFRDRDLTQPAFRTRGDQPTLFRLLEADKKTAAIATFDRYGEDGCYPPVLGTVGLDIKLFVARDALLPVTTEPVSADIAPGITATLHPGAWTAEGSSHSLHLKLDKTPTTSFSYSPTAIPDDFRLVSVPDENLPKELRPLARKRVALAMGSNRRGERHFDFDRGKHTGTGLVVRAGCVELRWKETPKRSAGALLSALVGTSKKRLAAGAKVYHSDGTEAGTVAAEIEVLPVPEPPLEGKLCGLFAGRIEPSDGFLSTLGESGGKPPPKDEQWVLCFDPPAK
jgi:hypothetical protein